MYTSECTLTPPAFPASAPPNEAALLTVADWRAAWRAGAAVRPLLEARLHRLAAGPAAPVWILRLDADALAPRLAELERLAAEADAGGGREALLARMPLFGVPFAVKDNIDVAGLPTTAACPACATTPARHASVVQRLLDAGALLVGKTNLDQFATGLVGTRSPYGAPASVFAADRVSGGSSSGSAVAVARGDVAFALGTDTAGSGRVPAAFNNLVGLKPTPGRVSTAGVLPACRSLDCVSVFALDVADAATVLAVIEGPDEADDYSRFRPGPRDWARPLRVGVPAAAALDDTPGYRAAWDEAVAALHPLAAEVVPLDLAPLHEVAALLYDGPWVAERYAVVQALVDQRPEAMDPVVAEVIGRARGQSAVDAFRGQYRLQAGQRAAAALWRQVDLLMVPGAPGHPRFADVAADPLLANARLGTYTNFVNLLDMAALALPAGFTPGGLPFGVCFVAPAGSDAALARWGHRWQAARALPLGGTDRAWTEPLPPAREPAVAPALTIAVVGAHLSGLPLNGQLLERGALLREAATTAPAYRLYELPGTQPRKPGLLRVGTGGAAIALELWDLPLAEVGSFLALIPPPLGLGSIELADGRHVHGFLCEAHALQGATDISRHGGWRAWLASR